MHIAAMKPEYDMSGFKGDPEKRFRDRSEVKAPARARVSLCSARALSYFIVKVNIYDQTTHAAL